MNYLEIIELRASNKDYENLSEKLTGFIDDLNKEDENYTVKLFRHCSYGLRLSHKALKRKSLAKMLSMTLFLPSMARKSIE